MNNTVSATGMRVHTQTSDNLFIANDELSSTTNADDANFKTALIQNVSGLLEPVSTINGKDFFYTSTQNVKTSGDAIADTYIDYDSEGLTASSTPASYDNKFSENYGVKTAVGYVDYVFQLKAINSSTAARHVNVTTLRLTYGGSTDTDKAFRVALFVQDLGTTPTAPAGNEGTLVSIVRKSDASYFTETNAVSSTSALAAVTKLGEELEIGEVAANTTNYYKVVVRLWLEGEDDTCNNTTFASLSDEWNLDIKIELQSAAGSLAALTYAAGPATKVDLAGASASATVSIDGISYYEITDKKLGDEKLYTTTSGTIAADARVYVIRENKLYDVTNQCTLPTA